MFQKPWYPIPAFPVFLEFLSLWLLPDFQTCKATTAQSFYTLTTVGLISRSLCCTFLLGLCFSFTWNKKGYYTKFWYIYMSSIAILGLKQTISIPCWNGIPKLKWILWTIPNFILFWVVFNPQKELDLPDSVAKCIAQTWSDFSSINSSLNFWIWITVTNLIISDLTDLVEIILYFLQKWFSGFNKLYKYWILWWRLK